MLLLLILFASFFFLDKLLSHPSEKFWFVNHCQIHFFSPLLLPCSFSGSYVLLRFCNSFLNWPPSLLSSSIQIYSNCRDFSKLYIQLCQSSALALHIYIPLSRGSSSLSTWLTYKANLSCSSLTTACFLLYVLASLNFMEFTLVVAFTNYPYHFLSLEWSPHQIQPLDFTKS